MGEAGAGSVRTLGGFVLGERIGAGAYGEVFRAEQADLGREAVVKVIHHNPANTRAARRFEREVRLASRLDHPFAAHVYAFGAEPDGTLWIAMELVRGEPLDELLKRGGPIPIGRFLPFLERLGEVVQSAHDQGIVHRDIKPSNVMVLTRAGRMSPKLIDLGIAKALDATTEASSGGPITGSDEPFAVNSFDAAATTSTGGSTFRRDRTASDRGSTTGPHAAMSPETVRLTMDRQSIGSPPYMSPEQWVDGRQATAQSDQYGLAILCFECLTGGLPFNGESLVAIAAAHASAPVPPLGEPLPRELDVVMAKALAKRADDRYVSVTEFVAAFRKVAVRQSDRGLPQLPPAERRDAIARAPAPLAETVALLEAQVHLHDARATAVLLGEVVVRWLGLVAAACQTALGPTAALSDEAEALLGAISRELLTPAQWLDVVIALVARHAAHPEAFPVPELVRAVYPADGSVGVERHLRTCLTPVPDDVAGYEARLEVLGEVLRAVSWVGDYPVVARRAQYVEHWHGLRRSRTALPAGDALLLDEVTMTNADGLPVCVLGPLVKIDAPSPGMSEELFLTRGPGRYGMRQVAYPRGFERDDVQVRNHLLNAFGGEPITVTEGAALERAPYRGLATFTAADADQYFGREREVEAFVNRLRSQGFVAVVGPSGAGKSSFVQAGVVPSLPPGWRTVIVRPGATPIAAMAQRLVTDGVVAGTPDEVAAALRADRDMLQRILGQDRQAQAAGLLLIVDQFEELVTLCPDPAERNAYADAIMAVADHSAATGGNVRVIVTLRDDYLVRAEQLTPLRNRLSRGLQLLTTPSPDDLRRIFTEPARRLGYRFDDDALPDRVVEALADRPGALALLSFTASKLWDAREPQRKLLTRKAYDALGGVGGALAQHAEQLLESLPEADRPLVREAFRHLVTADGTRAVISRADLEQVLGGPTQPPGRAAAVIDRLVDGRLLVASEGDGNEVRIEVIHEMLLLSWPRLVTWMRQDAEHARMRDQLRAAARQWQDRGRARGTLWRDEALTEYLMWRARYQGQVTDLEQAFGDASAAAQRRSARVRRVIAAVAIAALVVGLVVLFQANRRTDAQRRVAVAARTQAQTLVQRSWYDQGRASFADGDWRGALPFWDHYMADADADASIRHMVGRAAQAARTLAWDRHVFAGGVRALALGGADAATVMAASADGEVAFLASATGAAAWHGQVDSDLNQGLSTPEGFLVAGPAGAARVDAVRGVVTRFAHRDIATLATRCRNGDVVTSGLVEGGVKRWAADGSLRWAVELGEALAGAVCDADDEVVVLSGTHLWRVVAGVKASIGSYEGALLAASDDGRILAVVAGTPQTITVLDAARRVVRTLGGHPGMLQALALSADGTKLLSGDDTGEARLWTLADGAYAQLVGHRGGVTAVSFAPDGRAITLDEAGAARLWTPDGVDVLVHDEPGRGLALASGTGVFFIGNSDGGVRAVDVGRAGLPTETPIPFEAASLRINQRGERAVCTSRSTLELRDAAGVLERTVDPGLAADAYSGVALSDLGAVLVMPMAGTRGRYFGPSSGTAFVTVDAPGPIIALAALHERPWSAAGTDAGVVVVWDEAGAVKAKAELDPAGITAMVAHPRQALLAASDKDHGIALVDATTGTVVRRFSGHSGGLWSLAFNGDGSRLYSASDDGSVREWDVASGTAVRVLWGHVGAAQLVRPLHDGLLATVGADRTLLIWHPIEPVVLERRSVSRTGAWALEASADARGLDVLDPFGIRHWDLPHVTSSDDAIRAWLACAIAGGPDCTLD